LSCQPLSTRSLSIWFSAALSKAISVVRSASARLSVRASALIGSNVAAALLGNRCV
jgi:hypothetical protein